MNMHHEVTILHCQRTLIKALSIFMLLLVVAGCGGGSGSSNGNNNGVDTTPNLSNGAPAGVLSAGTPSALLSVTTDTDANCKYDTASGVDYSAMANTFSTSGGSAHTTGISGLTDGQTNNYYVRCQDGAGNANANDYLIAFAVARVGDAYYVATDGNDTNPGTIDLPWRTVAFATCGGSYLCPVSTNNPNKLQAGDTLYIRGGTYTENNIRIANSGVDGSPITIMGYPGEVAIIDGGFVYDPAVGGGYRANARNPVFDIDGVSYITVDGLTLRRGETANIFLGYDYSTTSIIIQNSDLKEYVPVDNSANIYINGSADDITIRNNYLHDMQGTGGNAAGIIIFNAGILTIRNNEIYSTYQGIYYKHSQDNGKLTIIENNLIYNQATFGIKHSNADSIIKNNIIRNVASNGIRIFEESAGCSSLVSDNNQILHNTIVDTVSSGIYLSRSSSCPGAVDTLVRDNLLYNFTNNEMRGLAVWPYGINYGATQDGSNTTFDNNLIYSSLFLSPIRILDSYYNVTNVPLTGTDNIQSKPIFEDYTNSNFTLIDPSPGKNAASDGTDMGANICAVGVDAVC